MAAVQTSRAIAKAGLRVLDLDLGGLEEERDKLVIKWVRFIQGEVLKRVRGAVYQKKFDQRELIKVGQRNFRKYLASRDWGW